MRDRIAEALKDHGARYVEIRLEQTEGTHLRYRYCAGVSASAKK
ncbi:MAG: hypothetical protein Q7K03_06600 [Dehalococcoidia bacterium]|nr:hypothetical protein [Dehalococcoidia bacterium]